MIFPNIPRTDTSPKRDTESDIDFLDRSSRETIERVRLLLNLCAANYPADQLGELLARIRSGDSRHFRSASFELLLHEYLVRLGYQLYPHPTLPNGSTTRPDFLVVCPDGNCLYLEAASASEDNGRDEGAEARKALALEALNSASHPAFMVSVDSEGDPTTQPSGRALTREVLRWLDTLDADALTVLAARDGLESMPELLWQHETWLVRVRPIPVRAEARGRSRRLIGVRGVGAGWIDGWSPIRDTVISKSRRYGALELPLVIAVNVDTFTLDEIDEVQALFGQEQHVFSQSNPEAGFRFERARNGAWRGPAGPRARRASGAWLFADLTPFTVAGRRQMLYINPWSHHAVPASFLRMPHAVSVDGQLQEVGGVLFRDVFGLHRNWPERA